MAELEHAASIRDLLINHASTTSIPTQPQPHLHTYATPRGTHQSTSSTDNNSSVIAESA